MSVLSVSSPAWDLWRFTTEVSLFWPRPLPLYLFLWSWPQVYGESHLKSIYGQKSFVFPFLTFFWLWSRGWAVEALLLQDFSNFFHYVISINVSGNASPRFRAGVREHVESAASGFPASRCLNAFIDLSLVLFTACCFLCKSLSSGSLKSIWRDRQGRK